MAIKFEKIEPGMVLKQYKRELMGNTTMREWGEYDVFIISVDREKRTAKVHWNVKFNPLETWRERSLTKLFVEGKPPKAYRDQMAARDARGGRRW